MLTSTRFLALVMTLFLLVSCAQKRPPISGGSGHITGLALEDAEPPAWRHEGASAIAGIVIERLRLASQRWRSTDEVDRPLWTHNIVIALPNERRSDRVMLLIAGGRFGDQARESTIEVAAKYAAASGMIFAVVDNIPAQPLDFTHDDEGPLSEDSILSESWVRYMETEDEDWIAHGRMVRAAREAMTAVESRLATRDQPITADGFTLLGGSKRGWTCWLTALEDSRVRAIAPLVIPILNMQANFAHHHAAYGFWAPTLADYERRGITDMLGSESFAPVSHLVDPYERLGELTMPKYIVNAAGDEFFLPDSDRFYFDDLPGHNRLLVKAGASHNITKTSGVSESILAWAAMEATAGAQAIPSLEAKVGPGLLEVVPSQRPTKVVHYSITNESARDFRVDSIGDAWEATELKRTPAGRYVARLREPRRGWTAHIVEATFATPSGLELVLSTQAYITPDTLPYE